MARLFHHLSVYRGRLGGEKRLLSTYLTNSATKRSSPKSRCTFAETARERALRSGAGDTRKRRPSAEGFSSFSGLVSAALGGAQQPRRSHPARVPARPALSRLTSSVAGRALAAGSPAARLPALGGPTGKGTLFTFIVWEPGGPLSSRPPGVQSFALPRPCPTTVSGSLGGLLHSSSQCLHFPTSVPSWAPIRVWTDRAKAHAWPRGPALSGRFGSVRFGLLCSSLIQSSECRGSLSSYRRLYGRVGGARSKMAALAAATEPQASGGPRPPVCLLVLGMAGSGKTTFVQVTCTARA